MGKKKMRIKAERYVQKQYPSRGSTKGLHVKTTSLYAFEAGYVEGFKDGANTDIRIELEKAYLAGYEKRLLMNNETFDFARELHAKSNFIKWLSASEQTGT